MAVAAVTAARDGRGVAEAKPRLTECHLAALRGRGFRDAGRLRGLQLRQADRPLQSELNIFLADQNEPYFKPKVKLLLRDVVITSVVPGDYDGDSQMDVLLTTRPKEQPNADLSVWIFWGNNQTLDINRKFVANRTFYDEPLIMENLTWHQMPDAERAMFKPHSHAFIDMNQDFTADLFLTTLSKAGDAQFEIWVNQDGDFAKPQNIKEKPKDAVVIGQSMVTGRPNTCCQLVQIQLVKKVSSTYLNRDWMSNDPTADEISFPITLHIGDYNMDGYPDALAILKNTSGSNQQAFLLENEECRNASCKGARRSFKVHWALSDLNQIKDATVATFFDIYEDGILDIIVLSKNSPKKELAIHALKNNFEADAYFVKVIVLSGLCSNDCPRKITVTGQLSQSAHFALQLPYTVLGLGRSANFLDHLFVGIPRPSGEKATRKQEWTAIIPNSQLIVIPFPHHLPRSWSAKLYLTPSNIVLLTAIALIGVCVFILAIIGILHWQEKQTIARKGKKLTGSILMLCDQPLYLDEGTNIRSKLTYRILYGLKEAFCCVLIATFVVTENINPQNMLNDPQKCLQKKDEPYTLRVPIIETNYLWKANTKEQTSAYKMLFPNEAKYNYHHTLQLHSEIW
ncbi:T-cell immunomodulatory protein, partial [Ophiophagus hannah]